jgi:hypothetical protein
MTDSSDFKPLSETTIDERISPIEHQINPSSAAAVESGLGTESVEGSDGTNSLGLQRSIDTIAARDDVPESRKPDTEVVSDADTFKGAEGGAAFDHDGDGKVGGSKPAARTTTK